MTDERVVHSTGWAFEFSQHVRQFCRPGAGPFTCRFLVGDGDGLHCAKFEPVLSVQIAERYLAKAMVARGDNCTGYPFEAVL